MTIVDLFSVSLANTKTSLFPAAIANLHYE